MKGIFKRLTAFGVTAAMSIVAICAALGTQVKTQAAETEITLSNGDFEQGDTTGWTINCDNADFWNGVYVYGETNTTNSLKLPYDESGAVEFSASYSKELEAGTPQREIAKKYNLSLCNITRGSKEMKKEDSAFKKILSLRDENQ